MGHYFHFLPLFALFSDRSDDTDIEHSYFGRKYIGVGTGGTLEIHGEKKLSWTFLNKTLLPGEANKETCHFEKGWGNRGIIVHVVDPKTGGVLHTDRSVSWYPGHADWALRLYDWLSGSLT